MASTIPDAAEILERLRDTYGEPVRRASGDPVTGLVSTILSQSTTDSNAELAMTGLRADYPSWEMVREASSDDIADAIRQGGLANQKASTIKRALSYMSSLSPELDPQLFDHMSDDMIMSHLQSIKGVGQKTAACVLMFDLERDVLPVDTHIHRVSRRLGLAPWSADANATQVELEAVVPPEERYAAHVLFIRHGRATCSARNPDCASCAVSELCDYARDNQEEIA